MHRKSVPELSTDPESAPLEAADLRRLTEVEGILDRGRTLERWWREATGDWAGELDEAKLAALLETRIHPECFRLTRKSPIWPEHLGYGFFDRVAIGGQTVPVLGRVQQIFFDQPKLARNTHRPFAGSSEEIAAFPPEQLDFWRDSVREFIARHFLRWSSFHSPKAPYIEPDQRPLARYLHPLSWRAFPDEDSEPIQGAENVQLYYKRRDTDQIGRFRQADRHNLDLRSLSANGDYSWVVFKSRLPRPALRLPPHVGNTWPYLAWPRESLRLGVVHQELLHLDEPSGPQTGSSRSTASSNRALYVLGFALTEDPVVTPHLREGFNQFHFQVKESGKILVRMIHVRIRHQNPAAYFRRPLTTSLEGIDRLSQGFLSPYLTLVRRLGTAFDPFLMFVASSQSLTGGWGNRNLGISRNQVEKQLLIDGAISFMHLMEEVLFVWRAIPDWTRADQLPAWVES